MAEKRDDGKKKALDVAVSQIEKQFGRGTIMKLGEMRAVSGIQVIPTGCLPLDLALGVGGFPRGRVVEVFGPEATGKTVLALHVVAEAQRQGGIAAYVDAEHALDPDFSRRIGVDIDNLLVSQTDTAEQALDVTEVLVRSNAVDVIVIDSVAALVPKAELEGEMGDQHVGLQARLMSQALRKLTASISKSKTCVIFVNQMREKIGVMFGSPETTPGGRALKFYATVRIDLRRIAQIKEGQETIGNRVLAKIVKNKVAAPFRHAEFDLLFTEGISKEGSLIDMALEQKIIGKTGSWFTYKDEHIGQGRENVRLFLKENPDIADAIKADVLKRLGLTKPPEGEKEKEPEK
jgi:recombination protein RecA